MSYKETFLILFYCQWREYWRNWVANTPSSFSRRIVKALEGLKKWASRNDSKTKTVHLAPRGWWGIRRMPLELCSSRMHSVTAILGTGGCHNHGSTILQPPWCEWLHTGTLLWENPMVLQPCLPTANYQSDRKLAPASLVSSKYLTGVHQMGGT